MSYLAAVDVDMSSPRLAWPRLQWLYFKDAGASDGEDTDWVDKLEWTGSGQPAEMPGNTGQLYAKVNSVKVAYPDSVADKDKPVEVWLCWMQQYLDDARKAATAGYDKTKALDRLRCILNLGVNCAMYHGLPERNADQPTKNNTT